MRTFSLADGQLLQIGDVTVAVLDVNEDDVLLQIDYPEGVMAAPVNSDLGMQSQWRLD